MVPANYLRNFVWFMGGWGFFYRVFMWGGDSLGTFVPLFLSFLNTAACAACVGLYPFLHYEDTVVEQEVVYAMVLTILIVVLISFGHNLNFDATRGKMSYWYRINMAINSTTMMLIPCLVTLIWTEDGDSTRAIIWITSGLVFVFIWPLMLWFPIYDVAINGHKDMRQRRKRRIIFAK